MGPVQTSLGDDDKNQVVENHGNKRSDLSFITRNLGYRRLAPGLDHTMEHYHSKETAGMLNAILKRN